MSTPNSDQANNQNPVAKSDNARDRIPPTKPPTPEDWRRLKRTAQQLVETIDSMAKRAKG